MSNANANKMIDHNRTGGKPRFLTLWVRPPMAASRRRIHRGKLNELDSSSEYPRSHLPSSIALLLLPHLCCQSSRWFGFHTHLKAFLFWKSGISLRDSGAGYATATEHSSSTGTADCSQAGKNSWRPSPISEDETKCSPFVSVSQGLDSSLYRAKQVDAAAAPAPLARKEEPSKPHRLY